MKILFDINHPAHVHLFKNFIKYLKKNNHQVFITTRNKEVTNELLSHYKLPYTCITDVSNGLGAKFKELIIRDYKIFTLNKKYQFDLALGTSVSIAHLTLLNRIPSYNFNEDDDGIDPLYESLTYPFTTKIIIPGCIRYTKYNNKRISHNSYHELAYLHPNNFKPDEKIVQSYGFKPYDYIIVRRSALKATHDLGAKGLDNNIWNKISQIIKNYPQISSNEIVKEKRIKPWDMHHILAFAKILISDSQTMTMEAAVLGVPSIRYSTFTGRLSVLEELEKKYCLTYAFIPNKNDCQIIKKLEELIKMKNVNKIWKNRKEHMLSDKEDLNLWMINFFKKHINNYENL